MSESQIATYLNDHLAGSVAALEILQYLQEMHAGTAEEHFYADIRDNVEQDQQDLELIMKRLGVDISSTRKAGAWLASKLTELKLDLDDRSGGALRVLEALEMLTMGIGGKRALWLALVEWGERFPELDDVDFFRLVSRAEEQGARVEHARLQAAMLVFSPAE